MSQINNTTLLFLIITVPLFAQRPFYKSSLKKDNLSYNWTSGYQYAKKINRFSFSLALAGNSVLFNRGNDQDYATDNGNIRLKSVYAFTPKFKLNSQLKGKAYNNENIGLRYNQAEMRNEINFNFSPAFSVIPVFGGIYDYKFKKDDPGMLYGGGLNFYNYNPETNSSVKADYFSNFYDFDKRKNRNHQLNFTYLTQFSELAGDSLYAGYTAKKHYEYYDRELNLEKIEIKEFIVRNNAQLNITKSFLLENQTQFKQRDFSQERDEFSKTRNEKILSNTANARYAGDKFYWQLGILNAIQINDFSQNISDNSSVQTAFNNHLAYKINSNQKLRWLTAYSKLEYNTPDSETNFDDRDEIRLYSMILYRYDISKRLQWNLYSNIKYFHQVFIYSQKSGFNKEEKEAGFGSFVKYQLKNVKNTFGGTIDSYYLTYDFDDQSNLVNRSLSISDTLRYHFLPKSRINLITKYELEEIGNLDWEKFVEQVTRKNHYQYYIFYLLHELTNLISIKPGISYIVRNDFAYSPEKRRIRNYRSESYWFELIWKFSKQGFMNGRINKFAYKNSRDNWNAYLRGNLEVIWYF